MKPHSQNIAEANGLMTLYVGLRKQRTFQDQIGADSARFIAPRDLEALREAYPQFTEENLLPLIKINDRLGIQKLLHSLVEEEMSLAQTSKQC